MTRTRVYAQTGCLACSTFVLYPRRGYRSILNKQFLHRMVQVTGGATEIPIAQAVRWIVPYTVSFEARGTLLP